MTELPPRRLPTDQFDASRYAGLTPVEMAVAIRRDFEFALPPLGRTEHRTKFGGREWTRITYRCEAEGCWFVCTPSSDDNLKQIIAHHTKPGSFGEEHCPSPPRRETLMSGLEEIDKLWREIDDVVDAIKAKKEYRGMDATAMNGYVKGLAFAVVMKDRSIFQSMREVAAEALRRWRMRQGQIPWAATPTRHAPDFKWHGGHGGWKPIGPAPAAATPPTKSRSTRKLPPPVAKPKFNPTADQLTSIKAGIGSGMFTADDFASMYGTTAEEIRRVAG